MSNDNQGDLDALIQGKIDSDNEFQATLENLSDEEKEQTLSQKKFEVAKQVYKETADKAAKNEELANNYKIRAEKAEKATPKNVQGEGAPKPQEQDLSPKDLYALMDAKVPQGQVDEVIKASKILGKTIPETLKDGFVQARLKSLAEEQQTADATNTGTSKRTSPKLSDDQIVQNFMEGKEVDPEALALARMNLRKKK